MTDDHSTDGTTEYLKTLTHKNIKTFLTPHSLSMSEHWEWALSHAQGEWCIFVGQDDGLQPYFFELADILTGYAHKVGVRTVMSERAYYFWPGCENVYGNAHISYIGTPSVTLKKTTWGAIQALTGITSYFELPQMYTTSLFHKDILEEARTKQQGKVFTTHPQDANLAAIACSLDTHYIKSGMPLGWVGSSPKSAGMAISTSSTATNDLRKQYLEKVNTSQLAYCPQIGAFSIGAAVLYFWGALLQTQTLRKPSENAVLHLKLLKYCIFCAAIAELQALSKQNNPDFLQTIADNGCSLKILKAFRPLYLFFMNFVRIYRRIVKKIQKIHYKPALFFLKQENFVSMEEASNRIKTLVAKDGLLQKLQKTIQSLYPL